MKVSKIKEGYLSSSRRAFSFSYQRCCSSRFLRSAACWAVTGEMAAGGGGSGRSGWGS